MHSFTLGVLDARAERASFGVRHFINKESRMDARQIRKFGTLRGARSYLDANPDVAAPVNASGTRKTLDDAIDRLTSAEVSQDAARNQLKGQTAQIDGLRNDLRSNHMRPIADVAKANFASQPNFIAFKLPDIQIKTERLLTAAREMSAAAAPHTATFVDAGLPADFIAQLDAATAALAKAFDDRRLARSARVGATSDIAATLRQGRHAVRVIDAIMSRTLKGDAKALGTWKNVIRVGGASSNTDAVTPATPATPATHAAPATAATPVAPVVAQATPTSAPATTQASVPSTHTA